MTPILLSLPETNPLDPMKKLYLHSFALSFAFLFSQQLSAKTSFTANNPIVSSMSPTTGTTGAVVTFHGLHFTGLTAVIFGNAAAASFTVVSDTVVTAVVGDGSSGSVILMNPNGWGGPPSNFTFLTPPLPPTILSV